jgi:hypothetical protein
MSLILIAFPIVVSMISSFISFSFVAQEAQEAFVGKRPLFEIPFFHFPRHDVTLKRHSLPSKSSSGDSDSGNSKSHDSVMNRSVGE